MGQLSSSHCLPSIEFGWLAAPNIMSISFLLVGDNPASSWATTLQEGLRPLGNLETLPAAEALARAPGADYAMIIIDVGAAGDLIWLITSLRRHLPSVPIVVATASPTWQTAREVFMAGANDYIRKTLDAAALSGTLGEILHRSR